MTSPRLLQKRRSDIRHRIAQPAHAYPQCAVLDCGRPTAAHERKGLNGNYCRAHVEHFRRHGSYAKASYKAAELTPHRARALAWLRQNADLPEVREAVDRMRTLYWRGRPEEAFRLAGKAPEERARIVWARIKAHGVDHLQPLAAWLAVCLCHAADLQPERKVEYRWVQAGKLLNRLSGGTHKRWESEGQGGRAEVTELHKYPASRGRVLRHLGEQVANAAKPLESHLEAIRGSAAASARLPRARKRVGR